MTGKPGDTEAGEVSPPGSAASEPQAALPKPEQQEIGKEDFEASGSEKQGGI